MFARMVAGCPRTGARGSRLAQGLVYIEAMEAGRMRVGLISDTHSPAMGVHPPEEVRRAFVGVDLILHAGDIYSSECLDWLEEIAPVVGVEVPPAPEIGRAHV